MMSSIVLHMQRHSVSSNAVRLMLAIIALRRMRLKSEFVVIIIIILTTFIISYLARAHEMKQTTQRAIVFVSEVPCAPRNYTIEIGHPTTHCRSDCFGCRSDFACCASFLSLLLCVCVCCSLFGFQLFVLRDTHIFIGTPNATYTHTKTYPRPKIIIVIIDKMEFAKKDSIFLCSWCASGVCMLILTFLTLASFLSFRHCLPYVYTLFAFTRMCWLPVNYSWKRKKKKISFGLAATATKTASRRNPRNTHQACVSVWPGSHWLKIYSNGPNQFPHGSCSCSNNSMLNMHPISQPKNMQSWGHPLSKCVKTNVSALIGLWIIPFKFRAIESAWPRAVFAFVNIVPAA